jgi:hypothetical protein
MRLQHTGRRFRTTSELTAEPEFYNEEQMRERTETGQNEGRKEKGRQTADVSSTTIHAPDTL